MKTDHFEKELKARPFRPVPPEWRAEILAAAQASLAPQPAHSRFAPLAAWMRELLWPCPRAWAGLAGAWVVILALHLLGTDSDNLSKNAFATAPTVRQVRMALQAQLRWRDELLGSMDFSPSPAQPALPPHPKGRSERRIGLLIA